MTFVNAMLQSETKYGTMAYQPSAYNNVQNLLQNDQTLRRASVRNKSCKYLLPPTIVRHCLTYYCRLTSLYEKGIRTKRKEKCKKKLGNNVYRYSAANWNKIWKHVLPITRLQLCLHALQRFDRYGKLLSEKTCCKHQSRTTLVKHRSTYRRLWTSLHKKRNVTITKESINTLLVTPFLSATRKRKTKYETTDCLPNSYGFVHNPSLNDQVQWKNSDWEKATRLIFERFVKSDYIIMCD